MQNAKWISSLMTSSVWTTVEGKEFSYEKHADGWRTRWLSELAVQKALTTVPLQVGGPGGGIVQLSTWEFRCVAANRCGRHFIEVGPILSGIQWGHSREELSKRWQKKWKPMFLRKHLDESHFLLPYRSKAAAASSQEGRCSDDMAFSLPASLMLLVHLANQKEQGEAFLKSFLTTFVEPCQVTLQAAGGRGRDGRGRVQPEVWTFQRAHNLADVCCALEGGVPKTSHAWDAACTSCGTTPPPVAMRTGPAPRRTSSTGTTCRRTFQRALPPPPPSSSTRCGGQSGC